MNRMKALAIAAGLCAMSFAAQAKTQVVWWDFLSGGDGVRMKTLIQQFNTENPDIEIDPTTLEWGTPFYTKVQTSAAVGQGPDVMTYHLSRLPLGVSTGTLRPFSMDELKSVGLTADDYFPTDWAAAHQDGKLYGVPLDIHSIILYYNKDALKAAGLLGDDGLPKGLDGIDNFNAALKKLSGGKTQYGVSFASSDGGTIWRIFYTLLNQQGGDFLKDGKILPGDSAAKAEKATATVGDWIAKGYAPKLTEYPASIALFTSGKAAFHINGVWEVPTMADLAKNGKLGFEWGAIRDPDAVRAYRDLGRLAFLRDPRAQGQSALQGEARGGAEGDFLDEPPQPLLGDRGPHPGVQAGRHDAGIREDAAQRDLFVARQDGGLRSRDQDRGRGVAGL